MNDRETEALRLLLVEHDAKSIANTFGLSVCTINDCRRDARRKLGVSSSREAARRLAEMDRAKPNIVGGKETGKAKETVTMERVDMPAAPQSSADRWVWLAGKMIIMSFINAAVGLSTIVGSQNDAQVPAQSAASATSRPAETDALSAARSGLFSLTLDSGMQAGVLQARCSNRSQFRRKGGDDQPRLN